MPVAHARVPVVPARLDPRRSAFVGAGREGLPRLRSRAFPPRPLAPRAPMASSTPSPLLGAMDPAIVGDRGPLHVRTPLLLSQPMSAALGRDVYIKLDALQPSGSFKLRGIGYACQAAVRRGATTLVSSSGGNAGLAVAYSGQRLGAPVAVVVPETTPEFIRDRLRSYEADVIVHGSQWSEANAEAERVAERLNGALVHPFEGETTWIGHATVIHEIADDLAALGAPPDRIRPSAVVTCVGGGGLLAGVLRGLREVGWGDDVLAVAAETTGADSLATSLDRDEVSTLPGIASVAKSLGAASPSPAVFEMCRGNPLVASWRVSDADAVEACAKFADDHRVLVEPACGAALAAVYSGKCDALNAGTIGEGPVVVEVCGGAIIDRATLDAYCEQFGVARGGG